MEGQRMPSGEPPKVRTRKPKTRDSTVGINQGSQGVVHGQQPPVRRSNRAAQQQQPPEVANWDGYGNADPAQTYPEHYGYGEEQYVDAHGYGYGGAQADAHQGYGYGNASQGYGYGDANQGYGYGDSGQGYGCGDASQGHGYNDAAQRHAYGGAQVDAAQRYGYGGAQGDGQGYVATSQHTAKQKPKNWKPKPVVDGAYQGEHQGSYESQNQDNGYGQPVQGSYEGSYGSEHRVDEYGQPVQDGYAYPEAYNPAPEPKAHKSSKSRKPSKDKSLKKGNRGDEAYADPGNGAHAPQHGEPNYDMVPALAAKSKGRKNNTESQYEEFPVPTKETPYADTSLPSRAITRVRGDHDGDTGSPRSRASQEGSGRSKSSDREVSGSNRAKPHRDGSGSGRVKAENETRASREGLTPRLNPVGKDGSDRSNLKQRSARSKESEGKPVKTPEVHVTPDPSPHPNPNPLNEHLRKTSGTGKPAYNDMSMAVFHDPNDRTLVNVKTPKNQPKEPPAARSSLDEWMKKQSELSGGNNFNQHESMIVMPDDNKELLETQMFGTPLSMKLLPVGETVDKPQYQPRGDTNQYQPVVEKPLYQPVQRKPYAKTPLLASTEPRAGAGAEQRAVAVYDAQGKQVLPNAKCMACVHGIGVPVARIATRIACRQCLNCGCTIL